MDTSEAMKFLFNVDMTLESFIISWMTLIAVAAMGAHLIRGLVKLAIGWLAKKLY